MTKGIYIYKERKFKRIGDKMDLYENLFNKLLKVLFDNDIKQFAITTNYLDENPNTEGVVFDQLLKGLGGDILKRCISGYMIEKAEQGIWITRKDLWSEVNIEVNKIERAKIEQCNFNTFLNNFKTKKLSMRTKNLILQYMSTKYYGV